MKRRLKLVILCTLVFVLFTSTVFATGVKRESINVVVNGITVKVNGELCEVGNILHKGTTYVSLRAISELLEKDISYDSKSKIAIIKDKEYTYAIDPTDRKLAEQEVLREGLKNDDIVDIKVEDGKMIIVTDSKKESQEKEPYITEPFSKTLNVTMNGVKISVNGKENHADNFVYDGMTYVPLRAISEMLNKEVVYDEKTSTANIDDISVVNPIDEVIYSNDISPEEKQDRFSTEELSDEISKAFDEMDKQKDRDVDGIVEHDTKYDKPIGGWVTAQELEIKKNLSFTLSSIDTENNTIHYSFYSKIPYQKIYEIEIPDKWDGVEIISNKIRIKKANNMMSFFTDDLVEAGIIEER